MKEVTVTLVLRVSDDTNCRKWIPDAIDMNLERGEELLSYEQTEEEVV